MNTCTCLVEAVEAVRHAPGTGTHMRGAPGTVISPSSLCGKSSVTADTHVHGLLAHHHRGMREEAATPGKHGHEFSSRQGVCATCTCCLRALLLMVQYGATPLFYAAEFGHAKVVRIILAAGADKDARAVCGPDDARLVGGLGPGGTNAVVLSLVGGTRSADAAGCDKNTWGEEVIRK